jgi:sugar O-acyltransferase (sialic acid O-acetyltransferase NeuD family)
MSYLVWGAKGHCLVVVSAMRRLGLGLPEVIVDNDLHAASPLPGVLLVKGEIGLRAWLASSPSPATPRTAILAIGGSRGRDRVELANILEQKFDIKGRTLIDPLACVCDEVHIGPGSQLLARSVLQANASIGGQCIVNTGAIVEHECHIGNGVHIGPGATLAGLVQVSDFAFIGAGAIVGAGAVVTRDVRPGQVVVGVPARSISKLS